MTKRELLATSVLAFGLFNSAEGMNGLQKQETRGDCNVCKESVNLSEALKIREKNPGKNIEFKNVTCDKDDFWNLLQTNDQYLVNEGIITLDDNND